MSARRATNRALGQEVWAYCRRTSVKESQESAADEARESKAEQAREKRLGLERPIKGKSRKM